MSDTTHIQWTDATWNTITGCTRVSEGCERCYIDRTPPFRMAHRRFDSPRIGGTTGVTLHEDRLPLPLSWRKPRRVFVNSLSDLFHEAVPAEHIAKVFAIAALKLTHWPLPNVWLGVSVESQKWAGIRIPALIETPAAVRFLSCEPLLGPVDLIGDPHAGHEHEDLNGFPHPRICMTCSTEGDEVEYFRRGDGYGPLIPVDWVIVGGESGPGARRMDDLWAMDLVVQCSAARVPVFVKQLGSVWARENGAVDRKGGDPAEWPLGLRERAFPALTEVAS